MELHKYRLCYSANFTVCPSPHNQEENSLEEREGWESQPERVLGSGEETRLSGPNY